MTKEMIVRGMTAMLVAALVSTMAHAADWVPTKQVEFIVAAGPGGALDQVARVMKQVLEEQKILGDKPLRCGSWA